MLGPGSDGARTKHNTKEHMDCTQLLVIFAPHSTWYPTSGAPSTNELKGWGRLGTCSVTPFYGRLREGGLSLTHFSLQGRHTASHG